LSPVVCYEPLSRKQILERCLAFVADASTLATLSQVSSDLHDASVSAARSQVDGLAKSEPLRQDDELNSILIERAEVETWIGLLHALSEEQFEVEMTAYVLESEMAGLGSVTDSASRSRAVQDRAGLPKIAQRFGFGEVERPEPSELQHSSPGLVCPYDGRPSRLLTFASSGTTCLGALRFASAVRKALGKRVRAGGLAWATVDKWGSWKFKSVLRAENYFDFDPVVPFRYMLDIPPYECIAPKCLLASPRELTPSTTAANGLPRVSLVLDLDETLIHTEVSRIDDADFSFALYGGDQPQILNVRVRPHAVTFLRAVARLNFEVVVFTASERPYAEAVLRHLDPGGDLVEHVLCREDCTFIDGEFTKDLGGLSRDLGRTVLVDNRPEMYAYHPDCGVPISSWFADRRDCELLRLLPGLTHLASAACADVRTYVRNRWRTHEEVNRVAKLLGRELQQHAGSPSPRTNSAASSEALFAASDESPQSSGCGHGGGDGNNLGSEDDDSMFYDSADGGAGGAFDSSPEVRTDEDDDGDEEGGEDEGDDEGPAYSRPRLMPPRRRLKPTTTSADSGLSHRDVAC